MKANGHDWYHVTTLDHMTQNPRMLGCLSLVLPRNLHVEDIAPHFFFNNGK